jgi:hypothetical protein
MWPKEHGAYGQFALPVLTALGGAGVSAAGVSVSVAAAACFVAHESALILLGLRGQRARREHTRTAVRWFACCAVTAAIAGMLSILTMPPTVRWSLGVAIVPASLLAIAMVRGHEKSWYGEMLAAVAFSALAVPIAMAAGAPLRTGAAIGLPFALLFVTSTLAVRTAILRVRGGGDVLATRATRRGTVGILIAGTTGIAWLCALGILPASTFLATVPGLVLVLALVVRPPQPRRLRVVGWTLVAASMIAAVVLIVNL